MGTRADFYLGKGLNSEWLGSIAWDGFPNNISRSLLKSNTLKKYEERLKKFFDNRDDVTLPKDGWPWPWNDSLTTDYSYAFYDDKVWCSCFGYFWFDPLGEYPDEDNYPDLWKNKTCIFPNMNGQKNVTRGKRSGLILF
jgi:hypothetical protein